MSATRHTRGERTVVKTKPTFEEGRESARLHMQLTGKLGEMKMLAEEMRAIASQIHVASGGAGIVLPDHQADRLVSVAHACLSVYRLSGRPE